MPMYNGLLATLIKGSSTGGEFAVLTGTSSVPPVAAVPAKMFKNPFMTVQTQGISGSYTVRVICSVGGSTFTIRGVSVASNGTTLIGNTITSGNNGAHIFSMPRPSRVAFTSNVNGAGFTAHVYLCGEY